MDYKRYNNNRKIEQCSNAVGLVDKNIIEMKIRSKRLGN